MRLFPFTAMNPIATGDYPPPAETPSDWTAEDGMPMGDEPLLVPDEELPYYHLAKETPAPALTSEELKELIREETPS